MIKKFVVRLSLVLAITMIWTLLWLDYSTSNNLSAITVVGILWAPVLIIGPFGAKWVLEGSVD